MPNKYSHSVVLAGYSSRGIIDLPNDQYLAYTACIPSGPYASSSRSRPVSNRSLLSDQQSADRGPRPYASSDALSTNSSARPRPSQGRQRRVISDDGHENDRRNGKGGASSFRDRMVPRDGAPAPLQATPLAPEASSRRIDDAKPQCRTHEAQALPVTIQEFLSEEERPHSRREPRAAPSKQVDDSKIPARAQPHRILPSQSSEASTHISTTTSQSQSHPPQSQNQALIQSCSTTSDQSPHHSHSVSEASSRKPQTAPLRNSTPEDLKHAVPPTLSTGSSQSRRVSPKPVSEPQEIALTRKDSNCTAPTQNYDPLPDAVDFNGFSDVSGPSFVQKLNVKNPGSTSKTRLDLNGLGPTTAVNEILSVDTEGSAPRSLASGAIQNASLPALMRITKPKTKTQPRCYASFESLSTLSDFDYPSLVRSQRTSQIPEPNSSVPKLPEIPHHSLLGIFDISVGSVAPFAASSHLQDSRNSLSMRFGREVITPGKTSTLTRDSTSESDASAIFPLDVPKYKIRNGTMIPLAQFEAVVTGGQEDLKTKGEKISDVEKTLSELKGPSDGRGRDQATLTKVKEKESNGSGGFLSRLRGRSLGRKKVSLGLLKDVERRK